MLSSTRVFSLGEAMQQEHGTEVAIIAVVASVGALDSTTFHPYGTRELCMQDASRIAFLRILASNEEWHSDYLVAAEVGNQIAMANRLLVNRDRSCLETTKDTSITFIESHANPFTSTLEDVRFGLRKVSNLRDGIKRAVANRCDELKYFKTPPDVDWRKRPVKDIYEYLINGERMEDMEPMSIEAIERSVRPRH
ncbi:unnamed protein product [Urochloa decumbens]|uniref:Uncharacterized protein n=1 Tax=Urochloa decumbens TaxID=240449 RepID=A0ABC9BMV7_9POAL